MEYGLTDGDLQNIFTLFKKIKEIETVYLYGERSDGSYTEQSDLKITFLGPDLNAKILASLKIELEKLKLPFKCDVTLFLEIKDSDLRMEIGQCGVEFYSK